MSVLINSTRHLKLQCAICQRPVDKITVMYSDYQMETIVYAYCHGARDRMTIPERVLAKPLWNEVFTAFMRGEIEGTAFDIEDQTALPPPLLLLEGPK